MEILIDTNVILNYITERDDPFREASKKVMKLCAEEKVNGFIAFHSLSIIWYILRKKSENERRFWLKNVCEVLMVVGATHKQVLEAIEQVNFIDFEDCLQDKCAQNVKANYIVTCNVNDFENAYTKVVNPIEFLKIFENFQQI